MKKTISSILISFLLSQLNSQKILSTRLESPGATEHYKKEIRKLTRDFRKFMKEGNRESFNALFLNEDVPWIAVFSDEKVRLHRDTKPDFPRYVDFGRYKTPADMIDKISNREEEMWNIAIKTDGYLGSVHFNFNDIENNEVKAFGTENWSVINTEHGWRIAAITYTVTEKSD